MAGLPGQARSSPALIGNRRRLTRFANATCGIIRLKLLEFGAQVRAGACRVAASSSARPCRPALARRVRRLPADERLGAGRQT